MADSTDLDKSVVETLEFRLLELGVVEAEEVVHDDVSGQGREGMTEIQGFLASFEFLDSQGEGVDVAVDDVDKVENGATREPEIVRESKSRW